MYLEKQSRKDAYTDNFCKGFRSRHTSNNKHKQQNIGEIHIRIVPLQ